MEEKQPTHGKAPNMPIKCGPGDDEDEAFENSGQAYDADIDEMYGCGNIDEADEEIKATTDDE